MSTTAITGGKEEITYLSLAEWQAYVDGHRRSSVFHHRNWIELLSEQYGFDISIPSLVKDGEIRAGVPFLQTTNLRGRKKLISLPFTDCLSILADDDSSLEKLCLHVKQNPGRGLDSVVIRGDRPVPGVPHESHWVRHELATDRSLKEIESGYSSTIRRNLNKGNRNGLQFHCRTDPEAMEIFFGMHLKTRRKLGVPVQPKSFFRRLDEKLIRSGLGFVGVVSAGNVPVASGVMLEFNRRLVYKYAASDPAALELRPNDCLVHNAIRASAENGCTVFDFGLSDKDQAGLRRFKSKWGAVEHEIHYSYLSGQPEGSPGRSRAMGIASAVIKNSPSFVCRTIGSALYKYSQ